MRNRVTRETIYGRVIYPDVLPRARGNMAGYVAFIISASTCVLAPSLSIEKVPNAVDSYRTFFVLLLAYVGARIVIVYLIRFTYFAEERLHLASRYQSNQFFLMKRLLEFSTPFKYVSVVVILSAFFIMLLIIDVHYIVFAHASHSICFGVVLVGQFVMRYLDLDKSAVHDSIVLEGLQPLDYGSATALNFFYGYLHLCLPNTGNQEKGLRERIDDFISAQKLDDANFTVKKLMILIPSSSYVPNNLKERSYGWMQNTGTLEKQIKDRAGVIGRVYKNSVYRIQDPECDDDPPVYVVAEGATPCKTLHEVVQHSGTKERFFQEHQKEIIFMFYERLREVIREHPNCKDLCELIYYVDRDEEGLDNVNVAKIILQRIREIKETDAYLRELREAEGL